MPIMLDYGASIAYNSRLHQCTVSRRRGPRAVEAVSGMVIWKVGGRGPGGGQASPSVSKTGGRAVPLAPSAVRLLASLPRDEDNPWVIAGKLPGSYLTDLQHPWRRIRERVELPDVRIHDLRHSFASRALALGEGLPMIGKLLGHTQVQTTARYAHLVSRS